MRVRLHAARLAFAGLAAASSPLPLLADPNCTCRAQGREFELGQSVCLVSPKGPRIAICGMVLNNTSWQFSDTPCVVSAVPMGPPQDARAAAPPRHGG
jgi:hypothetical protein